MYAQFGLAPNLLVSSGKRGFLRIGNSAHWFFEPVGDVNIWHMLKTANRPDKPHNNVLKLLTSRFGQIISFQKTQLNIHNRLYIYITFIMLSKSQSQWPRGLRRRSAAAPLLGLWVRIPPRSWMFVVIVNFETSRMRSQNKAGWTAGRRLQQIDNVAV